jgi:hypothetical protein
MKWESLNLHIENFIPGLISTILLVALFPTLFDQENQEILGKLLSNEVLQIGLFVSTAYIIGVLVVVLSRIIIDRLSELFPRPILLKIFARGKLKNKSFNEINEAYRKSIRRVLNSEKDSIKTEVLKRRERGRLLRTSFFPSLLAIFYLASDENIWWIFFYIFIALVVFIVLYAYVENTIYEECQLIED